jgi:hypothetical protein
VFLRTKIIVEEETRDPYTPKLGVSVRVDKANFTEEERKGNYTRPR